MEKKFSKFDIASIKRTAANCSKYRTQKEKNNEKIAALQAENEKLQNVIDKWDAPIKELTGFGVEELTVRVVNPKTNAATFVLKYPETVVPVEEETTSAEQPVEQPNETQPSIAEGPFK